MAKGATSSHVGVSLIFKQEEGSTMASWRVSSTRIRPAEQRGWVCGNWAGKARGKRGGPSRPRRRSVCVHGRVSPPQRWGAAHRPSLNLVLSLQALPLVLSLALHEGLGHSRLHSNNSPEHPAWQLLPAGPAGSALRSQQGTADLLRRLVDYPLAVWVYLRRKGELLLVGHLDARGGCGGVRASSGPQQ